MIHVKSGPYWSVSIIENDETSEWSFQCLCGGIAMYWQRVILTSLEVDEIRNGTFDMAKMVNEVCKRTDLVAHRLAEPLDPKVLYEAEKNRG